MTFSSFDAVFFTAGFLVPGFVWSAVLSMLVPRRTGTIEIRLLEALTLSSINHALWSPLLFIIFATGFLSDHPYWSGLFLGVIILLSPVGLGLLSGWLQQKQFVARFLSRFGFRTVYPIPTAWDWHFSRAMPYWALVTLKDGSEVYGFFGPRSYASDNPQQRDLYLEATYRPLETGDWAPEEDTAGVLIMSDQIAVIEFRKIEEVTYGE